MRGDAGASGHEDILARASHPLQACRDAGSAKLADASEIERAHFRVEALRILAADQSSVEGLNLRTTKIRALDGVVWFVANGEIRKVGNGSEGYNQSLIDIVVPPGTDLGRAGQVLEREAVEAASDPALRDEVIEAPEEHAEREIAAAASWLASSERRRPALSRAVLLVTDPRTVKKIELNRGQAIWEYRESEELPVNGPPSVAGPIRSASTDAHGTRIIHPSRRADQISQLLRRNNNTTRTNQAPSIT